MIKVSLRPAAKSFRVAAPGGHGLAILIFDRLQYFRSRLAVDRHVECPGTGIRNLDFEVEQRPSEDFSESGCEQYRDNLSRFIVVFRKYYSVKQHVERNVYIR